MRNNNYYNVTNNNNNNTMFRRTNNIYQPQQQQQQQQQRQHVPPQMIPGPYHHQNINAAMFNHPGSHMIQYSNGMSAPPPLPYGYGNFHPSGNTVQPRPPPLLHPNGFLIPQQQQQHHQQLIPPPPLMNNMNMYPHHQMPNMQHPQHQYQYKKHHVKKKYQQKVKNVSQVPNNVSYKKVVNSNSGDLVDTKNKNKVGNPTKSITMNKVSSDKSSNKNNNDNGKKNKKSITNNDGGGKPNYIPSKYRPPKLDTPEAIEKWRAERRKNWPSAKNIQRKTEETKKMAERGELREDEKHEVGLKGVSNKTSRGGNKDKRNRKYNDNKRNKKKSKLATNSNATLLEKLLKKSIEKEESAILQCFKLFVDNDFYRNKLLNTKAAGGGGGE
jgi:hypothetical protein